MGFSFTGQWALKIQEAVEDYAREKTLSEEIDRLLGFDIFGVERQVKSLAAKESLNSDLQLWEHLSPQIFQTPYSEMYRILKALSPAPGEIVVDLGCGYGRMAFVVEAFFSGVEFVGYEVSSHRVREARKVFSRNGLSPSKVIETDLAKESFAPISAGFYFIYDYGDRRSIEKTLRDLQKVATSRSIAVAARGRASRDVIEREHPWLSQIERPEHYPHFSIYRSSR